MARIFLSHSSADNFAAVAVRDFLAAEGWDDVFLDIDPAGGIAAAERWERSLHEAASRCEAVVFLVSRAWLSSPWCLKEFSLAVRLNKRLFGVLVEDIPVAELRAEMTAWQLVDLAAGQDGRILRAVLPTGEEGHVTFSRAGLTKLRIGLQRAGLDARFFAWPPAGDPDRPPYRGMRPLEAEDAGIFFGREAQIVDALDRLRGLAGAAPPRFMAILGASGAGKSSFMRAGLLPRLARDDRSFLPLPVIRPERAVLSGDAGLVASIEEAFRRAGMPLNRADVRLAVGNGAGAVSALLARLAEAARPPQLDAEERPPAPAVVLPLDQSEELFLAEGRAEADSFLALVAGLLAADVPRVIVLATIRSDSYEALQMAPPLEGVRQMPFSLPPLAKGAFQTVIEGPAMRLRDTNRALAIEPALTAALLADLEADASKDALPLLAFTLERLYADYRAGGELKLEHYRAIGGLGGSIEAAVAEVMKAAGNDADLRAAADRGALLRRAVIPWLATIDPETRTPRRRVARLSEIPAEARPFVRLLVAGRLLTTEQAFDAQGPSGEVTVEPAHEALLRQWGQLQTWLAEESDAYTAIEGIRRASQDWNAHGRDEAWLAHQAGRLEDAQRFAARDDFGRLLSRDDRSYLAAARTADGARRDRELKDARKLAEQQKRVAEAQRQAAERQLQVARRTRIGAIAAIVLALVAAGFWWDSSRQTRRAEEQAKIASQQSALASLAAEEASRQRREAEDQAASAATERDRAEQAARRAMEQEQAAREQAAIATRERNRALTERQRASEAELQAVDRDLDRSLGIARAAVANAGRLFSTGLLARNDLSQALGATAISAIGALEMRREVDPEVAALLASADAIGFVAMPEGRRPALLAADGATRAAFAAEENGAATLVVADPLAGSSAKATLQGMPVALGLGPDTVLALFGDRLESRAIAAGELSAPTSIPVPDTVRQLAGAARLVVSRDVAYLVRSGKVWRIEAGRFDPVPVDENAAAIVDAAADGRGGVVAVSQDGLVFRGGMSLRFIADASDTARKDGEMLRIRYNPSTDTATLASSLEWRDVWLTFAVAFPSVSDRDCRTLSGRHPFCSRADEWVAGPSTDMPWIGISVDEHGALVLRGPDWPVQLYSVCRKLHELDDETLPEVGKAVAECASIESRLHAAIAKPLLPGSDNATRTLSRLMGGSTASQIIDAALPFAASFAPMPEHTLQATARGVVREYGLDGLPPNRPAAMADYRAAAAMNDPYALYRLGVLLEDEAPDEAVAFYRRAMDAGIGLGFNAYAIYLQGQSDAADRIGERLGLLREAISHGDHFRAPLNLASMLDGNPQLPRRTGEDTASLLRMATTAGNGTAARNLARMIETGEVDPDPPGETSPYWRQSAPYFADSAVILADLIDQRGWSPAGGIGPPVYERERAEWRRAEISRLLRMAAKAGSGEASDRLAALALRDGGEAADADAAYLSVRAVRAGYRQAGMRVAYILARKGAPERLVERWTQIAGSERPFGAGSAAFGNTLAQVLGETVAQSRPPLPPQVLRNRDDQGRVISALSEDRQIEIGYDGEDHVSSVRLWTAAEAAPDTFRVDRGGIMSVRSTRDGSLLADVAYTYERFPTSVETPAGSFSVSTLADNVTTGQKTVRLAVAQEFIDFDQDGGPTTVNLQLKETDGEPARRTAAVEALKQIRKQLEPLADEPMFADLRLQPEATTYVDALIQAMSD